MRTKKSLWKNPKALDKQGGRKISFYLVVNWNFFLAPANPYFFLSFFLGSLVKYPSSFKEPLRVSSFLTKAREIPNLVATAWACTPPPLRRIIKS